MDSTQSSKELIDTYTGPLNHQGLFSMNYSQNSWKSCFFDLHDFLSLENNWDGEGAKAFDKTMIDSALIYMKILSEEKKFPPPQRIIPTQDGEIIIEWQKDNEYIEAVISKADHAEWMHQSFDFDPRFYEDTWNYLERESNNNLSYLSSAHLVSAA